MKSFWQKYTQKKASNREFPEDPHDMERLHALPEDVDAKLIHETVTAWLNGENGETTGKPQKSPNSETAPASIEPSTDRVLEHGLNEGLFHEPDVQVWKDTFPDATRLEWRQVAQLDPWRAQQLERLAARVYGFRSVVVCQMSSLVLADLLTSRISPLEWESLFRAGMAPVVEHGKAPLINGRIMCISKDPSSRKVRKLASNLTSVKLDLAYADGPIVVGTQELIAQHIPSVGAAVYTSRPVLRKIDSTHPAHKRAA